MPYIVIHIVITSIHTDSHCVSIIISGEQNNGHYWLSCFILAGASYIEKFRLFT